MRYTRAMNWLDKIYQIAGVPTLDPGASRSALYGGIVAAILLDLTAVTVVGLWARDAIVWTALYKLYAALAFWVLWRIPRGIVESIKVTNRTVPNHTDCDHSNSES